MKCGAAYLFVNTFRAYQKSNVPFSEIKRLYFLGIIAEVRLQRLHHGLVPVAVRLAAVQDSLRLSQHEKYSGKSIKYFDPELNESYTPYVVETSIGVDRMFLSVLSASYCEETLENGETRVVLKLPAPLAPVKLAVMPLVKKDGLPEKAREIVDALKFLFHCQYDEKDSIGKRYRRQDAIGTPYCVTVDHQSLEDNCVTLRNRDTMQQERVAVTELNSIIADRVSITGILKKLI